MSTCFVSASVSVAGTSSAGTRLCHQLERSEPVIFIIGPKMAGAKATAMGLYQDLTQAAQKVQLLEDFHPGQQNHDVYMKHFAIFERLSTKLFDEFEAISDLQNNS